MESKTRNCLIIKEERVQRIISRVGNEKKLQASIRISKF